MGNDSKQGFKESLNLAFGVCFYPLAYEETVINKITPITYTDELSSCTHSNMYL